jgi:hypothetical protein
MAFTPPEPVSLSKSLLVSFLIHPACLQNSPRIPWCAIKGEKGCRSCAGYKGGRAIEGFAMLLGRPGSRGGYGQTEEAQARPYPERFSHSYDKRRRVPLCRSSHELPRRAN